MAFPDSYVNGATLADALAGTSFNLDTDTIKAALFTDGVTGADKNTAESYASGPWVVGNEVSSAGYTAGGLTVAAGLSTPAAGQFQLDPDAATAEWTGVTFEAFGVVLWDDTVAGDPVLAAIKFPTSQDVIAGTFTITWDASDGLFYATY